MPDRYGLGNVLEWNYAKKKKSQSEKIMQLASLFWNNFIPTQNGTQ